MNGTKKFCCSDMEQNIGNDVKIIYYNSVFDEYGIPMPGDPFSFIKLNYCPWCGCELPISMRDEWFSRLEKLGYTNPLLRDDLPLEFQSDRWRI